MNSKPDQVRLKHLLDAARKISQFCHGVSKTAFLEDEKLQLAVVRLLEIAGEAANSISETLKDEYPQIPWQQITDTRNRLIHGYFDVDLNVVWSIITQDIPKLIEQLEALE